MSNQNQGDRMPQHQGKNATVVRDAKQGDPNFDAAKDQVIVKNADGTQSTVLRSDVNA